MIPVSHFTRHPQERSPSRQGKSRRASAEHARQASDNDTSGGKDDGRPARTKTSTGRRDIRLLDIPEERVEILNPALEGKAERIGFEESCLSGRRRGGTMRIVVAHATYKITADDRTSTFVTADKPKEIYERGTREGDWAHLAPKQLHERRQRISPCSETIVLDGSRPTVSLDFWFVSDGA